MSGISRMTVLWVNGRRTKEYQESLERQTRIWMQGIPWHNTVSDECTVDFSCCVPSLLEPDAEKRARAGAECLANLMDLAPIVTQ